MPFNPFKPPDSESSRRPRPPVAPGSPLRAVLVGLVVDIGGSTLIGVVLSILYAMQLQASGLSESEVRDAMDNIPPASFVNLAGIVFGSLMSAAGGYVCARIARRDEYRLGLLMAAISAFFSLAMSDGHDVDEMALLLLATGFACNLLGTKYGFEHNRRDEADGPPPAGGRAP